MGQSVNRSNFFDRLLKAGSGALIGSTLGLLIVATIDCAYARGEQFGARWLADLGLIAPVALLVGAGVAAARLFFHEGEAGSPRAALRALSDVDPETRARVLALCLCGPITFALWLIVVANLATRLLGSDVSARAAGAAIGLSALGLFWVTAQVLSSGSRALCRAPQLKRLRPEAAVFGGLGLAGLLLGYAVWSGVPSGAGGALAVFGVFKRPELDLRAPALLGTLALLGYFSPHPKRRAAALAAVVLGVL
ncbi:MAG TPA: hypothetical protein VK745_26160, partial [Polyangiaceae bacterium]|nr:hypothetical protein [Polyangiaceae bacterium]